MRTQEDLFIELADAHNEIATLKSKLDFYEGLIRASGEQSAEQFILDVNTLANEARRGRDASQQRETGEPCPHSDVIMWASVGMAQCRVCGSNLDRSFFETRDRDVLAIAELVGVSLPREPLPLIPGLHAPKHHFRE